MELSKPDAVLIISALADSRDKAVANLEDFNRGNFWRPKIDATKKRYDNLINKIRKEVFEDCSDAEQLPLPLA